MPNATVTVQIEANIIWQFGRDPDSGMWMGISQALNLNALGETFDEAVAMANDAMQLLFRDLFEQGDLPQFLGAHGWRAIGGIPEQSSAVRFDVPYVTEMGSVTEFAGAH